MSSVESIAWTKSSFCSAGACIEVAKIEDRFLIRDSKNPEIAPLSFTTDEWAAFVQGVNAGEFSFN